MKTLVVMMKDLRLIARDRSALLFILLVPIVVIMVVAETQAEKSKNIVFAVVNEDRGPVASALIKVFRDHLDVRLVDRATAEQWVAVEDKAAAAIVLPRGMSKRYLGEKPSTIELLTDPARWKDLAAIKVILLLADRETASLADPFHEDLITIKEKSLTGTRLLFSSLEQHIPGFSLMFVLFTLVFSVSIGLREEEVWGTSSRLAVAPASRASIIGGKLLARVVLGVGQLLLLLVFGHFVFGLTLGESPLALLLVSVAIVFSMGAFSIIVAAIAHTREQIIPAGMSVVFILAAVGGLWWPFYDQPRWMQMIGWGAMTSWSMRAVQDVILRNKSVLEIWRALAILTGYGIVCFAIGLRLFHYGRSQRS
jgi:ABC-type multidrug transport system permease subunit